MGRPRKITYEYINEFLQSKGCALLETFMDKKSNISVRYICSCGSESHNRFSRFVKVSWCRKCANAKLSETNKKLDDESLAKFYQERGCELLEKPPIKRSRALLYKCVCGNIAKTPFWFFENGRRCRECQRKNNSGSNHRSWNPDRQAVSRGRGFARRCQDLLYMTLRSTGEWKTTKTYFILGYTNKELMEHIRKHPNWEVVKNQKWSVDHIFPIKAFVDHGIKDPKIINCLENLQPLEKIENILKGSKYDKGKFEEWLKQKLQ